MFENAAGFLRVRGASREEYEDELDGGYGGGGGRGGKGRGGGQQHKVRGGERDGFCVCLGGCECIHVCWTWRSLHLNLKRNLRGQETRERETWVHVH